MPQLARPHGRDGRPQLPLLSAVLLLACVAPRAAAAHGAAADAAAGVPGAHLGRRLKQLYTLGVEDDGDPFGTANQRNIITALEVGSILARDTADDFDANVGLATTNIEDFGVGSIFTNNGLFGGEGKSTTNNVAKSSREGAVASSASDARNIGQPLTGQVQAGAGGTVVAAAQKLLNDTDGGAGGDDGADAEALSLPLPRIVGADGGDGDGGGSVSSGPNFDTLLAVGFQYGIAGDYYFYGGDYNGFDFINEDYGQPRFVPETALVTSRNRADVNDEGPGRAAAFGDIKAVATAPAAVTRHQAVSAAATGQSLNEERDDIFGEGESPVGYNPNRSGGTNSAGIHIGRSYYLAQPSSSVSRASTQGASTRTPLAGAAGDALGYASGAKSVTTRSQLVSATNAENIAYDIGRRRRV